jgi:16S rRNA (adenine1518-N6/adenine1519-N6)-dimethyltransferase
MIRPKKHLGQHFLRDENIAGKIVELLPADLPLVLEVGPGMGVLTKYIVRIPGINPWFMDVDRDSVDYLAHHYPEWKARFLLADFLHCDLEAFPPSDQSGTAGIQPLQSMPFVVIGNFPYNISSQILFKALEHRNRIPTVIGMFQKEVAERLASPPGNKTYGILSVLLQAWYDIEYLFTVSETVFYPPPKVKSAVIRLTRNSVTNLGCDEKIFVQLVKTAFNQRRKTLRNAIRSMPGADRLEGDPLLDLRAERLSVADFVRLAKEISNFA